MYLLKKTIYKESCTKIEYLILVKFSLDYESKKRLREQEKRNSQLSKGLISPQMSPTNILNLERQIRTSMVWNWEVFRKALCLIVNILCTWLLLCFMHFITFLIGLLYLMVLHNNLNKLGLSWAKLSSS